MDMWISPVKWARTRVYNDNRGIMEFFLTKYFKHGTVNVFNNNSTQIRRDEELVRWFMEEYRWLLDDPDVEVLYEITDFGVG